VSLVPSLQIPNGEAALDQLLAEARSVRAAVAFVTSGGVDVLAGLLDRHPHVESVAIVARGAPITEPQALLALRARLGVDVAVIGGDGAPGFHPKIWLVESASGELRVLSGSGNLTSAGLRDNREQFEVVRTSDRVAIEAQRRRFDVLTEGSIPLDLFEGSIAWRTWTQQLDRRAEMEKRLAALDRELAESPAVDREAHKAQLMSDLWDLYERTLAARLIKDDGHVYNPSGFRLQLEGKRGPKEPVPIAASICKSGTDGFDTILKADRPELTVEFLVVDALKPYHDLFPAETRRVSAERLWRFPSWSAA
jgi:HKD family nuclease